VPWDENRNHPPPPSQRQGACLALQPDEASRTGDRARHPPGIRTRGVAPELLYGAKPSFRDPARFSFAHGGKDGHPYPVDRELYDQSIDFLKEIVNAARIGEFEKKRTFIRLGAFYGRRK